MEHMEDECLYHSTCYRSNLQYSLWLHSNPCLLFPLISCFMLRCIISRSRPSDPGSGCSLHAGSGSGRNQLSLPEETLTSSGQVGYRSSAEQHQVSFGWVNQTEPNRTRAEINQLFSLSKLVPARRCAGTRLVPSNWSRSGCTKADIKVSQKFRSLSDSDSCSLMRASLINYPGF